jgi:hypothetical protein
MDLGLRKTLSNEFAKFGVTFNTILPRLVHTGNYQNATREQAERGVSTELVEPLLRVPVDRWAQAEDVSAICAFLCSDRASSITGQSIAVDGGWLKGLFYLGRGGSASRTGSAPGDEHLAATPSTLMLLPSRQLLSKLWDMLL